MTDIKQNDSDPIAWDIHKAQSELYRPKMFSYNFDFKNRFWQVFYSTVTSSEYTK